MADSEFGKGVLPAANREGSPYLIDLKIAQRGMGQMKTGIRTFLLPTVAAETSE
ncbi:hypothetical protein N9251_02030 [Gammaproteobacteria bacterium]|nr:hypothetical protein [Gammaproteobacteria bacterium]